VLGALAAQRRQRPRAPATRTADALLPPLPGAGGVADALLTAARKNRAHRAPRGLRLADRGAIVPA